MNLSSPKEDEEEEVCRRNISKPIPTISIISDGSLAVTPPLQSCCPSETKERLTTAGSTNNDKGGEERVSSAATSSLPLLRSLSTTWSKRGEEQSVTFFRSLNSQSINEVSTGEQGQDTSVVPHNPWERILQCFQVFKPKKVSASDDEDVSSKKKLGEGGGLESGGLKKTMTENDLCLYELAEKSEILKVEEAVQIGKILPPRAIGYPWDLRFTTSIDGFSLHSLYRKMDGVESPVLLILETVDEGGVLGAILSTAPKVAESFYGGGDTALLKLRPAPFSHYPWSGTNFYFIQGHDDCLSIGSDGGKFGLWLDDNLYNGRTQACGTFGSPPLLPEGDFKVKTLEAFTLASLA